VLTAVGLERSFPSTTFSLPASPSLSLPQLHPKPLHTRSMPADDDDGSSSEHEHKQRAEPTGVLSIAVLKCDKLSHFHLTLLAGPPSQAPGRGLESGERRRQPGSARSTWAIPPTAAALLLLLSRLIGFQTMRIGPLVPDCDLLVQKSRPDGLTSSVSRLSPGSRAARRLHVDSQPKHGTYEDVLHNLFEPIVADVAPHLTLKTQAYDVVTARAYPSEADLESVDAVLVTGSFEDDSVADETWILRLCGFLIQLNDSFPRIRIIVGPSSLFARAYDISQLTDTTSSRRRAGHLLRPPGARPGLRALAGREEPKGLGGRLDAHRADGHRPEAHLGHDGRGGPRRAA
jgi:hypothetical protein